MVPWVSLTVTLSVFKDTTTERADFGFELAARVHRHRN